MNDANNQAHTLGADVRSVPHLAEILHTSDKKPYVAPELKQQAHLRDITLGGTPGPNEPDPSFGSLLSAGGQDKARGKSSDSSGGIFDNDIFEG